MNQSSIFWRSLFCSIIILFFRTAGISQTGSIVPVSPNAATFQRFNDYPVDYSTGLANVAIPIYDIKLKDFNFPISLKFHGSGYRPSDEYSSVGLGWMLDATGYISREIRERPDELYTSLETSSSQIENDGSNSDIHLANPFVPYPYSYFTLLSADMNVRNAKPLQGINESNKLDAEHDIYSYSVNGMSGKFILNKDKTPVPLTYTPCKIEERQIKDDQGNTYEFGGVSGSTETTDIYGLISPNTTTTLPMTRFLSKIKLATGEEINFKYGTRSTASSRAQPESSNVTGRWNKYTQIKIGQDDAALSYSSSQAASLPIQSVSEIVNYFQNIDGLRGYQSASYTDYLVSYLTEIDFPDGIVSFSYDDINLRLTKVTISNNNGELIRAADFFYINTPGVQSGDFTANNEGISLKSISFSGNQTGTVGSYNMNYYEGPFSMSRNSSTEPKTDWWGYANEKGDRGPYDPSQFDIPYIETCLDCKIPNFNDKLRGMLKSITYPTGGTTEFEYEPNYFLGADGNKEGPGIRIKQMVSYVGNNTKKTIKSFKYGFNESGYGYIPKRPDARDFMSKKMNQVFGKQWDEPHEQASALMYLGSYWVWTLSPFPMDGIREAYNEPLYYDYVSEYTSSDDGTNNGKQSFSYSIPQYYVASSSWPYVCTKKEYTGAKLTEKNIYSFHASQSNYKLLQQTDYYYDTYIYKHTSIPQIKIWRNWSMQYDDGNINVGAPDADDFRTAVVNFYSQLNQNPSPDYSYNIRPHELYMDLLMQNNPFTIVDIPIETGIEKLKKEWNQTFDENGNSSSFVKNYFYDESTDHMEPVRIETSTSKGDKISTETKYSMDFYSKEDIWARNNPIIPLEVSNYRMSTDGSNKRLLNSSFTQWDFTNNVPLKQYKVEIKTPITDFTPTVFQSGSFIKDSRYKEKVSFNNYDANDNPLEIQKTDDIKKSYVWQNDYPIAEVTNASQNDIAYSSFEIANQYNYGGWNFLPSYSTSGGAVTGKQYYDFSQYFPTISNKNALDPTKTYIVSYWTSLTIPYTVAGTVGSAKKGFTINGWTYYEHEITNVTTTSITSQDGNLDELRLYPKGALMTTYTYKPLVGMTSQCDVNNRIIYYEYDGYARLKLTRGQDKNIIKIYNYAYNLSPSVPVNDEVSRHLVAPSCPSGTTNVPFTYTVPAGKYQAGTIAQANQKAQDDLNVFEQKWLNEQDGCIPPVAITINASAENVLDFYVTLVNQDHPDQTYYFTVSNHSQFISTVPVPVGPYSVSIETNRSAATLFNASICGLGYIGLSSSPISFTTISIDRSSCNTINIF